MIEEILGFFCHQIPERTIQFGQYVLPVCSRCSGIYIGVLIIWMVGYKRRAFFPILGLSFILIGLGEAVLESLSIIGLSNSSRFFAGELIGAGFMILVHNVRDRIMEKHEKKGSLAILGLFMVLLWAGTIMNLQSFYFVYFTGIVIGAVILPASTGVYIRKLLFQGGFQCQEQRK